METQGCLRAGILKLVTLLIFSVGIVFSKNTLPSDEKYIMGSYFKKHDRLLDSEFQDFIALQFPCGSEVFPNSPRWSIRQCNLIGEGSHRRLSLSIASNDIRDSSHFCEVVMIERLPPGIFADPFELQHLLQRGAFSDVAVFGDTNLELPAVRSNRSVLELHIDMGEKVLARLKSGLEINVELPLHVRYPRLDESGYSRVKLVVPDLFLRCQIKGKLSQGSCLFKLTDDSTASETSAFVWSIPSGMKAHAGIVYFLTFMSASLSALLIVIASVVYSDVNLV